MYDLEAYIDPSGLETHKTFSADVEQLDPPSLIRQKPQPKASTLMHLLQIISIHLLVAASCRFTAFEQESCKFSYLSVKSV